MRERERNVVAREKKKKEKNRRIIAKYQTTMCKSGKMKTNEMNEGFY